MKHRLPTAAALLDLAHIGTVQLVLEGHADVRAFRSVDEVQESIRRGHAHALVISTARLMNGDGRRVAKLLAKYPETPVIAWAHKERTRDELLRTGHACGLAGARTIVHAEGNVRGLREALANVSADDPFVTEALHAIEEPSGTAGWRKFAAAIFVPETVTIRALSKEIGITASTLMSRFWRAGLPAPKVYLAAVRLMRVARLMENRSLSIADVSLRLWFSSPQSMGRHIKELTGLTADAFRNQFDGAALRDQLVAGLINPYRDALRSFDPLRSHNTGA